MKIKDWSGRLIFATVIVTVVRYMGAFAAADLGKITGVLSEILTVFLAISGAGMGILDVMGGGLLFNGWRMVMPRSGQHWSFRFWVLTICVFMLLASGSVILVPFTVSRMTHNSIVDTMGGPDSNFTWLWAWMVVLVPYFIIIGVFVGNRMVEGLETNTKVSGNLPSREESSPKVSGNLPTDWRKLRPKLSDEQVNFIALSKPSQIVETLSNAKPPITVSLRTALNWRNNARRELGLDVEQHVEEQS